MTQHAHPNIYTAIQLFKDIQNSIEIAKIQRVVGGTIRPRAHCTGMKLDTIKVLHITYI
jgi:hypothetical protein